MGRGAIGQYLIIVSATLLLLLAPGCSLVERVFEQSDEAGQVQLPSLPLDLDNLADLQDLVKTAGDLGLPDLTELPNVPQIDSLPLLEVIPGGMVFRGPVQFSVRTGETVPGTNIVMKGTRENEAEFAIGGLRSVRRVGDSLDYDGAWPGLPDVSYSARLRIYRIGDESVRVAGVHQLGIPGVFPEMTEIRSNGATLTFPTAAYVAAGNLIPGTTFGYAGRGPQGAELTGLARNEYPYRKTGDSIVWRGLLRADIPVEYNIRTLHFDDNALQVGGVAKLYLPAGARSMQGGE